MRALTIANTGKPFEIKKGELFEVTLATNGSAGYTWKLVEINADVLKKIGVQTITPKTKMIGSENKMIFTFLAQKAGEGKLKLHYLRSWEDKEPEKIFEITVKVK